VNLRKRTHDKTKLREWQDEKALKQLIKTDTWSRIITKPDGTLELRKSLLDHLYTSTEGSVVTVLDKWTSDHHLILLTLPNKHEIIRHKTTVRSWRKYSKQNLENLLEKSTATMVSDDANILNMQVCDAVKDAMNELCPLRVVRTARGSDLVSDEVERIKKKRKRKMAQYNKTPESYLLAEIANLDRKLNTQLEELERR
jgi:hypothetical protein